MKVTSKVTENAPNVNVWVAQDDLGVVHINDAGVIHIGERAKTTLYTPYAIGRMVEYAVTEWRSLKGLDK